MNKKFYQVLTFSAGLMLASNLTAYAQKVTFNGEQVSLKQAFEKIESVSKYKIAYNASQLDVKRTVVLNQKNKDVLQVLEELLKGTGYTYKINENYIVISPQQKSTIKKVEGIVKDTSGEPVIGATVMEKGTNNGTITDFDGKFTLQVTEGASLEISYIGFKTQQLIASSGQILVSIRPTTGIKPLYTTIATVTMNLIVSAAIVLLNPYVTVYISYKIPPFALSVHIPDVSTSIYVEVDSKVLLGLPSCDKAFVR